MSIFERRALVAAIACAAWTSGACAPYRPPFTRASSANVPADLHQATLVFLWPTTSCDPGGYYLLATTTGRFIGSVSAGTQLRAEVPAGEHTVVGWNEAQEDARGGINRGSVSVLHGTLVEGRTYYVRMSFGEWDERGPREIFGNRSARRICIAPDHVMTSAMVTLTPASEEWKELPEWTTGLGAIVPDRDAGQTWMDGNREALETHRAVAESRFERLRPVAKRMATIEADDGMPASR